jgi:glutathione S-transferase
MITPVLYVFAISHYCEKARWALDYLGVDYRLRYLAPGPHIKLARSLGVADTFLPILVDGEFALQGSSQIVDWAQAQSISATHNLTADDDQAGREIEQRLDDVLGVHVRRYYYSDALLTQPETVKPMFARYLPWQQRLILHLAWGKIVKLMIRGMDLGPEQRLESRQIIETELDWLDGLLAEGRQYLLCDHFTRTDLCAASLLAPLALPAQHPTYPRLQVPAVTAAELEIWKQRPCVQWVREMYRRYRWPATAVL